MKKLIAISVIFALVAGAAFAEMSLGAEVFMVTGVKGGGDADLDATGFMNVNRVRLNGSGQNDDGTVGASFRLDRSGVEVPQYRLKDDNDNDIPFGADRFGTSKWYQLFNADGLAWWKPIDQIKFVIGSNFGDGEWGLEGLTGWGFYGLANEVGFGFAPWAGLYSDEGFSTRSAFFAGWNAPGFQVCIYPVEGFTINVGVPFDEWGAAALVEDVFKAATFQATYDLDGVGLFGLTYDGNADNRGPDADGMIYLFADLKIVDGLDLNVAFSYDLEWEDIGFGVAAQYGITDEFNLKGSLVVGIPDDGPDFVLLADLLPSYAINDTMTIFCGVSLGYYEDCDDMSWGFNPYLKISTGWAQDVYAGVKVKSIEGADADWSFNVGITMGF